MAWRITEQRSIEPPAWINDLLLGEFGANDFGDPLFRVIWGMSSIRRVSKEEGGYEDMGCERPAWLLQRWVPPSKWGSPELFRIVNRDPANGQLLFPFPEYGEYESVKDLGDKPVDYELFHSTLPFLQAILKLSELQVKAYKERQKELENKRQVDEIADRMMDALPTRYGPVSYSKGGCRTSLLDRKMNEIQKVWDRVDPAQVRKLHKGLAQGRVPIKVQG